MFLYNHQIIVRDDDEITEVYNFLQPEAATRHYNDLIARCKEEGYTVHENSGPFLTKLCKNDKVLCTIQFNTKLFDDGKRFYVTDLTAYDQH